jgi:hypothetical protein
VSAPDHLRILDAEHQRLAAKCLRYKEGLELVANLRDSEEARIYLNRSCLFGGTMQDAASQGTAIEFDRDKMLESQSDELKRMNGLVESLRGQLQTEERCRLRAERVISLVAHSNTGDYGWCKGVCFDYLNR